MEVEALWGGRGRGHAPAPHLPALCWGSVRPTGGPGRKRDPSSLAGSGLRGSAVAWCLPSSSQTWTWPSSGPPLCWASWQVPLLVPAGTGSRGVQSGSGWPEQVVLRAQFPCRTADWPGTGGGRWCGSPQLLPGWSVLAPRGTPWRKGSESPVVQGPAPEPHSFSARSWAADAQGRGAGLPLW